MAAADNSIMSLDLSLDVLSQLTIYMKYARYLPEASRRETWDELVTRNMQMHLRKFPTLHEEIKRAFQFVFDKKVLPSMRALQFGGKPIEINPARGYNCSALPIDSWETFSEVMFLLLSGCGVGYSVQFHHVEKLPEIKSRPKKKRRYLISDSIEGWADAIKVLVKSYFFGHAIPEFDYRDIRPKGAPLQTGGGKAPGPQPLKDCLHNFAKVLDAKEPGSKLTPIEVHDLLCHIADAVLSGGVRRSAMIALFSLDDEAMLTAKHGAWYELNPQRGRANNSAVVVRHRITKKKFLELWEKIQVSGSGEPGILLTNDKDWLTNPCCEIALRPNQMCNLTTINASTVIDQADLNERARAAAFLGTLQATYTDFHYLRDIWRKQCEKDALIGVSMTGIASSHVLSLDLQEAAECVLETNEAIAKRLGINPAARTTTVKPEGTVSCVVGTSSGIHAWHAPFYIRRIRISKVEPIYRYLKRKLPQLIEDDYFKPTTEAVLSLPIRAPEGAIFRTETAIDLLERVKRVSIEWIKPGHRSGENRHNVSATVSIRDDEEWRRVGLWMWENRAHYSGLSVLPYDGGSYKQAPFEEIDEATYLELVSYLKEVDLSQITEEDDATNLSGELACSASGCEIR